MGKKSMKNKVLFEIWQGRIDVSMPIHKTLFCIKSIAYLNIVWDVNLKVISF